MKTLLIVLTVLVSVAYYTAKDKSETDARIKQLEAELNTWRDFNRTYLPETALKRL